MSPKTINDKENNQGQPRRNNKQQRKRYIEPKKYNKRQ